MTTHGGSTCSSWCGSHSALCCCSSACYSHTLVQGTDHRRTTCTCRRTLSVLYLYSYLPHPIIRLAFTYDSNAIFFAFLLISENIYGQNCLIRVRGTIYEYINGKISQNNFTKVKNMELYIHSFYGLDHVRKGVYAGCYFTHQWRVCHQCLLWLRDVCHKGFWCTYLMQPS